MSETDPAARAFEDLCAEMTVLQRSVEAALPQAWRDNRPPDYTDYLARVGKAGCVPWGGVGAPFLDGFEGIRRPRRAG